MPKKYDVIIIGAGIGGLTAGAVLSKKGKKVLLLERIPVPGGCSVNFRRKNFEFDASLHLLNGLKQGEPSYRLLEECGLDRKISFLKPSNLYRSIFPDFDIRVPQCDPKAYISLLGGLFPREKENINELFNLMIRIYNRLWDTGDSKISPADFVDYIGKTCQDVFDSIGISEKAVAVIAQLWPFLGLPPRQLSFFIFASTVCDYIYNGGYYPKGGAQAIADALVEIVNANGGTTIFGNAVRKVLIKDKCAYGVSAKDRREFLSEAVISNANPRTTFYELVGKEHLTSNFLEKMEEMEPSISSFLVYLGLNTDPRNFGATDYTVFESKNYDLDSQYELFLGNKVNDAPIEVTFHDLLEGSEKENSLQRNTMSIVTMSGYDFWRNFSRNEYVEKKKEMADVLINRAERIFPGLSSCIETMEIATPRTIEKFTGNYKGAIYGWNPSLSQTGKNRMKQKTPIRNLYLSGAWTEPAGGVMGVVQSGIMSANKILNKDH